MKRKLGVGKEGSGWKVCEYNISFPLTYFTNTDLAMLQIVLFLLPESSHTSYISYQNSKLTRLRKGSPEGKPMTLPFVTSARPSKLYDTSIAFVEWNQSLTLRKQPRLNDWKVCIGRSNWHGPTLTTDQLLRLRPNTPFIRRSRVVTWNLKLNGFGNQRDGNVVESITERKTT